MAGISRPSRRIWPTRSWATDQPPRFERHQGPDHPVAIVTKSHSPVLRPVTTPKDDLAKDDDDQQPEALDPRVRRLDAMTLADWRAPTDQDNTPI